MLAKVVKGVRVGPWCLDDSNLPGYLEVHCTENRPDQRSRILECHSDMAVYGMSLDPIASLKEADLLRSLADYAERQRGDSSLLDAIARFVA